LIPGFDSRTADRAAEVLSGQDVRIERDHGSRVMAFRESQVIFGRRGAAAIASRQRSMFIPDAGFGDSIAELSHTWRAQMRG